jgi:phosphatidylinositol dimannoside acyltransferase
VTGRQGRLEAPHRRLERGPRLLEIAAVTAYKAATWLLSRVPPAPAAAVIGAAGQLSYLVWPTKRRWSNANFGHVLGLPPSHPRVRRVALAAYREYGNYLVEVMRLSTGRTDRGSILATPEVLDEIDEIRARSKGGLIFVLGHVGNVDAAAAAVGHRMNVNVVADDSSFPEMFEIFTRERESWGNHVIPWRNLREIYTVLRRRELLALLVDWGYREDGVPVRLFGAWTTLPAGPATLAAKTGSLIVPIGIRRVGQERIEATLFDPIEVASTEPGEIVRATQQIAQALEASILAAPEQWYSFKPLWPATPAETRSLEARARAALGGDGGAMVEPGTS